MAPKLILTIKKDIIVKAMAYARSTDKSLSELIENYLDSIIREPVNESSQKLKEIIGSVKLPKNFNEEKERRSYLTKKHLQGDIT